LLEIEDLIKQDVTIVKLTLIILNELSLVEVIFYMRLMYQLLNI